MKLQKVNTIPAGLFIVILTIGEILLTSLIAIVLLPSKESFVLLMFSLVFFVFLLKIFAQKYCNFIEVSDQCVRHGKDTYTWEEVCITVDYSKPNSVKRGYVYYAFFDNHFLTAEEVHSKAIKRKGFYLMLTRKRLERLFSSYMKELKVLGEAPECYNRHIIETIKSYNLNFLEKQ